MNVGDIVITVLISLSTISVIFLIVYDKQDKKKKLNKLRKLSHLTLSDLHIKEFNKYVDITMMSGDTFKNIDMEEYESINDPMKKGSHRIHRRAIESERHHSLGKGYFELEGMKINVKIYGDENKNINWLETNSKSKKITGCNRVTWDYDNRQPIMSTEDYSSWTYYDFEIKK